MDGMIQILGSQQISREQLQRLRRTAEEAMAFFEQHFGPVESPLKIDVGPDSPGLTTGYNLESDTISFPKTKHVVNLGLDSVDVIDHEIFHALVARRFPHTSTPEKMKDPDGLRLHEGLADYFAYKLHPDRYFGENYRDDKEYLRDYNTQLAVSLAPGSHAQGNAITSLLLREGVELAQIRQFLERGEFTLEALQEISPELKTALQRDASFAVSQRVPNYPQSAIHRYRIEPSRPLQVEFEPNGPLLEAHPDFRVAWSTMEGLPSQHYQIEAKASHQFEVKSWEKSRPEKLLALFYDGKSLIGSQPYYFSTD